MTITLGAIAVLALLTAAVCIWDSRQKHQQKKATAQQPQWTELDRVEFAKLHTQARIRAQRQHTEDQLRRLSRWYS
jgi:O-methyltransferase involved in polyketide biosynthesis